MIANRWRPGQLPATFSKSTRYHYLAMTVLFAALSGVGWYRLAVSGPSSDVLGLLITSMIILVFSLGGFLISFAGRMYRRESGAELRQILEAGEFTAEDESREKE